MKALVLNCSLKSSSEPSSTEALASRITDELANFDVSSEIIRVTDYTVHPGVTTDEGSGDQWPALRQKVLESNIIILASPTWVGRLSSVAQRVIERMDAMLSETDERGRPVAYNHVAGFVATGNEDGAKHVIAEMTAALTEIGFTVPGQAWTYYNQGSPMGPSYLENEDLKAKDRPHRNAVTAAHNLYAVALALQSQPMGAIGDSGRSPQ